MDVKRRVKAPRNWTKVQYFTYVKHVHFWGRFTNPFIFYKNEEKMWYIHCTYIFEGGLPKKCKEGGKPPWVGKPPSKM